LNTALTETSPRKSIWLTRILWISFLIAPVIFAGYITQMYLASAWNQNWSRWNIVLDDLYNTEFMWASIGIGIHFVAGIVLLILGPFQFISSLRNAKPYIHRMVGKIYVFFAILTSTGGLIYIFSHGTLGGFWMNLGFGFYGVLLLGASLFTWYFAVQRSIERHRRWALRLFVLGLSSWLYRVEYALWGYFMDGLVGHNSGTWDGPLDYVMHFFFYIPTLILCEIYIRKPENKPLNAFLWLATPLIIAGTLFALMGWWLPAIKE